MIVIAIRTVLAGDEWQKFLTYLLPILVKGIPQRRRSLDRDGTVKTGEAPCRRRRAVQDAIV